MSQQFTLVLLNQKKLHQLLWGLLGIFVLIVALIFFKHSIWGFEMLLLLPISLLCFLPFRDKFLGEKSIVTVQPTGIEIANKDTNQYTYWLFEQIQSYRIVPSGKGDVSLLLKLSAGTRETISGRYTDDFAAMLKAFEQTLRCYNLTVSASPILLEKGFFERPISTKILLGLLAVSALLVTWGSVDNVDPSVYALTLLLVLPYLSVWAVFSDKRG